MADVDADDFFEEDEPLEKIKWQFEHGEKFVTVASRMRGQTGYFNLPGKLWSRISESLSNSRLSGKLQHN